MKGALLLLCAVAGAVPLAAQSDSSGALRVRLTLDQGLKVGRRAPALVLPYATRDGLGPADQPFDLAKELGRVVVLVFYPGDFTPTAVAEWQALNDRAASLLKGDVVVAGISADSLATHVRFAQAYNLPFKFLSDRDLDIARLYDSRDGSRARRTVLVVGRDGKVRYLDQGFAALDPQSYVHLSAAVQSARESR